MQYLMIGVILILALFAIRLSNRHGIPALLLFIVLGSGHEWENKLIRDLSMPEEQLIVMVQRPGSDVIVPMGDTLLHQGDKVIILKGAAPEGKKTKGFFKR